MSDIIQILYNSKILFRYFIKADCQILFSYCIQDNCRIWFRYYIQDNCQILFRYCMHDNRQILFRYRIQDNCQILTLQIICPVTDIVGEGDNVEDAKKLSSPVIFCLSCLLVCSLVLKTSYAPISLSGPVLLHHPVPGLGWCQEDGDDDGCDLHGVASPSEGAGEFWVFIILVWMPLNLVWRHYTGWGRIRRKYSAQCSEIRVSTQNTWKKVGTVKSVENFTAADLPH